MTIPEQPRPIFSAGTEEESTLKERQEKLWEVTMLWCLYRDKVTRIETPSSKLNHNYILSGATLIEYSQGKHGELLALEALLPDKEITHAAMLGIDDPRVIIPISTFENQITNPFLNDDYGNFESAVKSKLKINPNSAKYLVWAGTSDHYKERQRIEQQKEIVILEDEYGILHALTLYRGQNLSIPKGATWQQGDKTVTNPNIEFYQTTSEELGIIKQVLKKSLED